MQDLPLVTAAVELLAARLTYPSRQAYLSQHMTASPQETFIFAKYYKITRLQAIVVYTYIY
jgi:hypothetical protein